MSSSILEALRQPTVVIGVNAGEDYYWLHKAGLGEIGKCVLNETAKHEVLQLLKQKCLQKSVECIKVPFYMIDHVRWVEFILIEEAIKDER